MWLSNERSQLNWGWQATKHGLALANTIKDPAPQSLLKKHRLEAVNNWRSHFEATRRIFSGGPRNFEPRSDDEDDTRGGTSSPNFRTTLEGERLAPYV
ncbi:hypothetical protein AVEN_143550-1 [Araneus ventricosus]|uniref:Uncharacterized protein n=1 Tax=Araneus ventricosus TaxID=182803 RepID=A0A4Y2APR9_ARAVE|nr:hypothetical protein AVEN_143550-1 [Araneus ventricosus]